ncbi:MAG: LapA family protein [Mariprofundaceae bacterium]|nr:LapA family protein [Mariprofundaceae bacterium]
MNWLNVGVSVGLAAVATAFALANTMPVKMGFLGWTSAEHALFMPVFMAFFFGFLGGVLALSFSRRKHKREISFLRKENSLLHQEVENLRNIPLQDDL